MLDNAGNVLVGRLEGDNFIVQHGPDFDAVHEVYDLAELSPVDDVLDYPLELDGDYSDVLRFEG